jgi:hypothetical protein
MSQMIVIGGIIAAVLLLWWVTTRAANRGRKNKNPTAMQRENTALRHIVSEMAKEKHQRRDGEDTGRRQR